MGVLIGTSGWQYRHWRERFYPSDVPQRRWLEHYAERFRTVESNAAFYRLPERETFADWARRTPPDFVWAVKASRYLTHLKRLREPDEPVRRLLDHAEGLGSKFACVLLQLPPTLKADHDSLDATLRNLSGRVRVAVEFRHASWWTDETRSLLERHGAALCWADRGAQAVTALWRTTDWGYVRFHWGGAVPDPCYDEATLGAWAERVAAAFGPADDVYVYFNNDPGGCAILDAAPFARAVEAVGLRPSRCPGATAIT